MLYMVKSYSSHLCMKGTIINGKNENSFYSRIIACTFKVTMYNILHIVLSLCICLQLLFSLTRERDILITENCVLALLIFHKMLYT